MGGEGGNLASDVAVKLGASGPCPARPRNRRAAAGTGHGVHAAHPGCSRRAEYYTHRHTGKVRGTRLVSGFATGATHGRWVPTNGYWAAAGAHVLAYYGRQCTTATFLPSTNHREVLRTTGKYW